MARQSTFLQTGVPDAPLQQDASYKFDPNDRAYIDAQVLAAQTVAAQTSAAIATGVPYTPTLDNSGGVVPGNLVGSAASAALMKKLLGRGYSVGPSTTTTPANGKPSLQVSGLVPQSITGLSAANPGPVIRDPSSGNMLRVAEPRPDDDYLGEADAIGNLIPRPMRIVKPAIRVSASDSGFKSGNTASANVTALRLAVTRAAAIGTMCGMPNAAVGIEIDGGSYDLNDTVVLAANDADNGYQCGIVVFGAQRSRASGAALNTQINWTATAPNGTTGTIVGATGVVTGITGATAQSVGQYLAVTVGANIGHYPIKAFNSATSVTIDINGGLLADQAGTVHWYIVKPMFSILSRDCAVENMNFFAGGSAAALCGIQITQSVGTSPRICTRNAIERVRVSGEGGSGVIIWGVTIGDAIGANSYKPNCDFMRFVECVFDRTLLGGVAIPNTTGQSKRHSFWDCAILGNGTSVQYGIRLRSGSFSAYSTSFNTIAYGIAATTTTDTIEVYSPDVENCARFLFAEGGQAAGFPVLLCGGRYDVTNMGAMQTACLGSSDGIYIKWNWSPLTMVNPLFGGPCDVAFGIQVNGSSNGVSSRCTMLGGVLPGTSLPWVQDVTNNFPQTYSCKGVVGTTSGGATADIANGTTEYGAVVAPTDTIPTLAGVAGVSTGTDRMKNFEGSVAIGGATTSAQITFGSAELNDGYRVRVGVESLYGTPAAGSLQTYVSPLSGNNDKKAGFTLSLGAAPGTNACNEYHWQIIGGRWTPYKIAGLRHLWLAHQKVSFSSGVIISSWNDLISNTALTPPGTPPTIATWRNGMPACTFVAASSQYLQSAALGPYAQPHTIAMVLKDSDTAAVRYAFDGKTLTHLIAHQATPNVVLNAGGGIIDGGPDLSLPTCLISVFNGTSSSIYVNGAQTSNASNVGSNSLDGITLGASLAAANFWNGSIAVVADISGVMSAADAASFTSWSRDLYAF